MNPEHESVEILKQINEKMDILMRFFLDKNDVPVRVPPQVPVRVPPQVPVRVPPQNKNADCDILTFAQIIIKGKFYLMNCRGDLLTEQYEWVGRYNQATKTIDTTFPQPRNLLKGGRRKTRSKKRRN